MNATTTGKRSPILFVVLILLFSIPFYFFGQRSIFPKDVLFFPATALMAWLPLLFAVMLTYSEAGWSGVRKLLKRAFDFRKIKSVFWYVPMFCLLPAAMYLAYLLSNAMGASLPPYNPLWADPLKNLAMFFLILVPFAIGEELGWMGYAADPLQERWGTTGAMLFLGTVWALWHVVPWYVLHDGSVSFVVASCIATLFLRTIIFWLYNNNNGSVFAGVIFHATFNISYRTFPNEGSSYDPVSTAIVLAVITALIVFLWKPKTLADFRFSAAHSQAHGTR